MSTRDQVAAPELPLALIALPPFPAVALKAMRIMSRQDSRLRDLHDLIRSDLAFSSEILRIVNSPLFPFPTEITNTLQAVMLLGFERVQSLAVAIGVRVFLRDVTDMPAIRDCWRHSLACAILAEHVSRAALIDKDAAYTCGVLHDIGRLALAATRRDAYTEFLESLREQPCDILLRERELFGVDHCQAGQQLLKSWNLPERLALVAARHHDTPSDSTFDMLAVIRVACGLADTLGFSATPPATPALYDELRAQLPPSQQEILPPDPQELADKIHGHLRVLEV